MPGGGGSSNNNLCVLLLTVTGVLFYWATTTTTSPPPLQMLQIRAAVDSATLSRLIVPNKYNDSYHLAVKLSLYNDDPTTTSVVDAELIRFCATAVTGTTSDTSAPEFFFRQQGSSMTSTAEVTLVFDYGRRGDVAADELVKKEMAKSSGRRDGEVGVGAGQGPGGASLAASGDRCRVKYP
nr:unnamed protein product [Digitaria exilis]